METRFEAAYTADVLGLASGGLERGVRYLDNLDVVAEASLPGLFNEQPTRIAAYGLYNNGRGFSGDLVGDLQGVSNIEAPEAVRLYEFWVEQGVTPRLSVRAGLYDLNSEFDVIESSRVLLNSSHGIGPDIAMTGENGPSIFPVTSLALRTRWELPQGGHLQFAVLDAVPGDPERPSATAVRLGDGWLGVAEAAMPVSERVRVAIGGWWYGRSVETLLAQAELEPSRREHSAGGYMFAEAALGALGAGDDRPVKSFIRYGRATSSVNQVDSYLGAGLNVVGLFAGRAEDESAIAIAHARLGDEYRTVSALEGTPLRSAETVLEITYAAKISERLSIQPDLQFVLDPSGDRTIGDAWIVGMRFALSFSRESGQ